MRTIIIFCFLFALLFATSSVYAQVRKIDTTASFGNAGYRVTCNNKNEGDNQVSISPKGFGKEVGDLSFSIKGRLRKILIDDLNADGYPDLILCIYGGANGQMGNIAGIASSGNSSLLPVHFPDIYSNPKLSEGYKGYDEFSVMVGTLLQSFPVYKQGDTDTPGGGTRVVQYKIMNGENGGLKFSVLRSYEKKE